MRLHFPVFLTACLLACFASADATLLQQHCGRCHAGKDAESEFRLSTLGDAPTRESLDGWLDSLDRVQAEEMPPKEDSNLSAADRRKLIAYLKEELTRFDRLHSASRPTAQPRRMNNREFASSIADVLLIEDIGTHLPTADLLGDSRHQGFDTHGETLGFSKFHLEQYVRAVRNIVDATILSGERPAPERYEISASQIFSETTSQNIKRPERAGKRSGFDFLDPKQMAYFRPFKHVPATGSYRIAIRVIALDRGKYDSVATGIYDDDPIRLLVAMGDRQRVFDLPDDQEHQIELTEWMAAGSRLKLQHPTDGLRLIGNGNFKFQNRITALYFKEHKPDRYAALLPTFSPKNNGEPRHPDDWHNWVDYWMGPRPRILGAVIEGPNYKSWPPARHVALIGRSPSIDKAHEILRPIAERAWRRPVRDGELDDIIRLVHATHAEHGIVNALKEGIVAILVSPQFLLLGTEDLSPDERFASKFAYLIQGTTPSPDLQSTVAAGGLDSHEKVAAELKSMIRDGRAGSLQREFPFGWLELGDINFMAPDPDKFRHYHRKRISEDMIDEVLHLFRHATEQNIPVPQLLLADYSFVNADLAKVYGLTDVPPDSQFRKYHYAEGRRGGLLGTGAFLTSTADSLATSPIHRAIYVMENFLGIHPTPPPADVEIKEPDVRQAKTIKEILSAHRNDENCQACHQLIDPFGYAFENFGPDGSWRDVYTVERTIEQSLATPKSRRAKPEITKIPIDSGSEFLSGSAYTDIAGFRELLASPANQSRIVRCFITKLLTYANGIQPAKTDFAEIDRIAEVSKANDYRIVDTIAAVIHSPLFRER